MPKPKLDAGGSRETGELDIISDLPDSILCHILSFLPTKTAVATAILSRRWRHVWEYLQVFEFQLLNSLGLSSFVAFVDNVLARRRVPHIQKFGLSADLIDSHATPNWIRSAVGPQLRQLDLSLGLFNARDFVLPRCVFSCSTLVSLTLRGIFCRELPSVHLPSLKSLCWFVMVEAPVDDLLSGCPLLETLNLVFFHSVSVPSVKVPPSVKRLTLAGHSIVHLQIDAPSLEYLDVALIDCTRISCSDLPNVAEAFLRLGKGDVCTLLTSFCKTKLLLLRYTTIECLFRRPVSKLPEFCGLLHLRLCALRFNPRFIVKLLRTCPVLQVLKIERMIVCKIDESSNRALPKIAPKCVVSELTTFGFSPYEDSAMEQSLIAYILRSGLVLKTVRIVGSYFLNQKKKREALKRLYSIPRGSNICQLKFEFD